MNFKGNLEQGKPQLDKLISVYKDELLSFEEIAMKTGCRFKIDELDFRKIASNELIVYDVELSDYIARKVSVLKLQHKEPFLNEIDISQIYTTLSSANITDQLIRAKHVLSLKEGKTSAKERDGKEKCCVCDKTVSENVKAFCLSNKKFDGKVYCFVHQKSRA